MNKNKYVVDPPINKGFVVFVAIIIIPVLLGLISSNL